MQISLQIYTAVRPCAFNLKNLTTNNIAKMTTCASDPVLWDGDCSQNFNSQGFVLVDRLISEEFAGELCRRLDGVLDSGDGAGDVGKPDKVPPKNSKMSKIKVGEGGSLTTIPSKRTLQVINIWKADSAFK